MHGNSHRRPSSGFVALGLTLALAVLACTLQLRPVSSAPTVDSAATNETKALFLKLWTLSSSNQTLFGHQDDTYFGVGWSGDPDKSDVRDVSGSYPAVYGWDLGALELGGPNNVDGVPFARIHDEIIAGYRRGGVITISWHMFNPATFQSFDPANCVQSNCPGSFYDMTPAVSEILPGGTLHSQYVSWLDTFATFDRSLTVSSVPWDTSPHQVPVILRLFHEHNSSVFWWGGRNTNARDYVALWRFTVRYLRDTAGLHNLLYAYSPDARVLPHSTDPGTYGTYGNLASFQSGYFYAYPGDAYVDVFGLDDYMDVADSRLDVYKQAFNFLVQTAHSRNNLKIPALTETGGQRWLDPPMGSPYYPDWWTSYLYPAVIGTRSSRDGQVAYVLTWRNWSSTDSSGHLVIDRAGPYPDGADATDFNNFKNRRPIILGNEIAPLNLYTWP